MAMMLMLMLMKIQIESNFAGEPSPTSFFLSTLHSPLTSTTLPLFSSPSAGSLLTSFFLATAGLENNNTAFTCSQRKETWLNTTMIAGPSRLAL